MEQEAAQVLGELDISFDEAVRGVPQPVIGPHGTLPTRCEGCGAPLIPDEVEWHDAHTAECPYCGTLAKLVQI